VVKQYRLNNGVSRRKTSWGVSFLQIPFLILFCHFAGILASSACQFHLFYAGLNAAMTGGLSRITPFPCTLKGINKGILAEPA